MPNGDKSDGNKAGQDVKRILGWFGGSCFTESSLEKSSLKKSYLSRYLRKIKQQSVWLSWGSILGK